MGRWKEFMDYVKSRGRSAEPGTLAGHLEDQALEASKHRLYQLHLEAKDLFYVEDIWFDSEESGDGGIRAAGEAAKGGFRPGDSVLALDKDALPLAKGKICSVFEEESTSRGITKESARTILAIGSSGGEAFRRAQFLVKG